MYHPQGSYGLPSLRTRECNIPWLWLLIKGPVESAGNVREPLGSADGPTPDAPSGKAPSRRPVPSGTAPVRPISARPCARAPSPSRPSALAYQADIQDASSGAAAPTPDSGAAPDKTSSSPQPSSPVISTVLRLREPRCPSSSGRQVERRHRRASWHPPDPSSSSHRRPSAAHS